MARDIEHPHPDDRHASVARTGAASANAAGSVAISGLVQGDVYAYAPRFRLAAPARSRPPDPSRRRLVQLLDPRRQVVPFVGRDAELDELTAWLSSDRARAARLVTGPGGQGKTRLVEEFARSAAVAGWQVLVAERHLGRLDEPDGDRSGPGGKGRLVVVDYAERLTLLEFQALLTDRRLAATTPLRVLLTARSPGHWWEALRRWLAGAGIATSQRDLAPVAPDLPERRELFHTATERFAALLPRSRPAAVTVPDLAASPYGNALNILMAALVAVDATRRPATALPADLSDLYNYLLDRESERWQELYDTRATGNPPPVLARAAFVATLTGRQRYEDGLEILVGVGVCGSAAEAGQLLDDHRRCYPCADPEMVLEPLFPDRLGEAYVALALPGHRVAARSPQPWAAAIARALLGQRGPAELPRAVRGRALAVLTEAAHAWPHVTDTIILPLLRSAPQAALAAGGGVLARLVDLPGVDVDTLALIEPVLPPGRHLDFDHVACEITGRLVRHRLAGEQNDAERARLHLAHGRRLAYAGDPRAALAAMERAVAGARAARQAEPTPAAASLLAQALRLRGLRLAALDRDDRALDDVTEAVEILSSGAADGDRPTVDADLAAALDSLGLRLSGVGRHEEGARAAQRAVTLYEQVAGTERGRLGLAGALANLAVIQARLGRPRDALATARRAEEIWRRLAADAPAVFRPELAVVLNTLGLRYADAHEYDRAVRTGREAVELLRDLVRVNAPAFEVELAAALVNLGGHLWRQGRRTEAFQVSVEAEEIFVRWGTALPDDFAARLRECCDTWTWG